MGSMLASPFPLAPALCSSLSSSPYLSPIPIPSFPASRRPLLLVLLRFSPKPHLPSPKRSQSILWPQATDETTNERSPLPLENGWPSPRTVSSRGQTQDLDEFKKKRHLVTNELKRMLAEFLGDISCYGLIFPFCWMHFDENF